jgi:hypothetical protein
MLVFKAFFCFMGGVKSFLDLVKKYIGWAIFLRHLMKRFNPKVRVYSKSYIFVPSKFKNYVNRSIR